MSFVFSRLPALRKRAYVARYLAPLDIPPEFVLDAGVAAALETYAALQADFKEAHMAFERATTGGATAAAAGSDSSSGRPLDAGAVHRDLGQLTSERVQLQERLSAMRARELTPQFKPMLEATTALRVAQEMEARLAERVATQRAALAAAEARRAELSRKVAETRAAAHSDSSGMASLEAARREAAESRSLHDIVLPATLAARRETLERLQQELNGPRASEEDVERMHSAVEDEGAAIASLTATIAAAPRAAGGSDDGIALFRQQSALVARQLAAKEAALESSERACAAAAAELDAAEARMSQVAGPRYLRRDEFAAFAAALRSKTASYRAAQEDLSAITARRDAAVARAAELTSAAEAVQQEILAAEAAAGATGHAEMQVCLSLCVRVTV